jgi:predicted RecA/RadA family phage recombinase
VVGAGGWDLPNWVQGYEQYWQEQVTQATANGANGDAEIAAQHAANAKTFGEHLKGIRG